MQVTDPNCALDGIADRPESARSGLRDRGSRRIRAPIRAAGFRHADAMSVPGA